MPRKEFEKTEELAIIGRDVRQPYPCKNKCGALNDSPDKECTDCRKK